MIRAMMTTEAVEDMVVKKTMVVMCGSINDTGSRGATMEYNNKVCDGQ